MAHALHDNRGDTPVAMPLRILVVDDEPLLSWSVAETLAASGHLVTGAASGLETIRVLAAAIEPPDVVLLDYRLPDAHDLDLLTTIRRLSPQSAVILMSAHLTSDLEARAIALGAYSVVGKPFDMGLLPGLVQRAAAST